MESGKLRSSRDILFVLFALSIFNFQFSPVSAQEYKLSKTDTADVQYLDGKKYYILKVNKSETLYSICKRFNVSQDELTKINPWIKDGLKVKSKLWIPAKTSAPSKAPAKAEEKDKAVKEHYNVALFLPLNLQNVNYNFVPTDSVPTDAIHKETLSSLQFYEGVEYAVDSLASKECRIHLTVYDTKNDTFTTSLLLKEWRLKDIDFIISQSSHSMQKQISKYSSEHKLPLFTYTMNATEALKGNSYAWALQPSSYTQCFEAAKFAATRFSNANPLIIKNNSSKEAERATAFQSGYTAGNSEAKPKIIDFTDIDTNAVLKALVKGKKNILFVSTSNEDVVNPLLLVLRSHKEEYDMTIVGLPTWQYFESIDMEVLESLNTHIFTSARQNNALLPAFRDKFRKDYLTEPLDAALQGFDIMMLVGTNFMLKTRPDNKNYNGIFSNYTFSENKGIHENNFISMWKYRNGELIEIR